MIVEFSVIRDFVAIFGVIAGFSYYVLTVRANQKSQRIAEKNNRAQILQSYNQTEEDGKRLLELLSMEWNDYDEFERKYGSDYNPVTTQKETLNLINGTSLAIC